MGEPIQLGLDFQRPNASRVSAAEIPIDEAFPEEAANELAALEAFNKHLYRPNTYMHKWWARRSGTTFRHILKQLVRDPLCRDFYEPGGLEGTIIFDPMMGGATTLHEAIRMGANIIGVDIDPIPVLQARATLAVSSVTHKKAVFTEFIHALRNRLSSLYRTRCPTCGGEAETQFVLNALRRRCSCKEVLLLDRLVLRQDKHGDTCICPTCLEVYSGPIHTCRRNADKPLMEKTTRRCEQCNMSFADITDEPFTERYVPLVVVGFCLEHGQFFKAADEDDLALLDEARVLARRVSFGDPQLFSIPAGPKSRDLTKRGIMTFLELFTPRQMLYLNSSLELLHELPQQDRLWLALLISTSLEFNSLLCGYKGSSIRRPGAIRHVFSHHAYSFPYTAVENNPTFSGHTSGTLNRLFRDRILRAGQWAVLPVEVRLSEGRHSKVSMVGEIDGGTQVFDWESLSEGKKKYLLLQADSATLEVPQCIVDYVVTDPPYFDSVQYSDLSNFFRVWLRLFLPNDANWNYDPLASAVSEGDVFGNRKYCDVMEGIWRMCLRVLNKETGRLIFTFHHWSHEAWSELTLSLRHAGFGLVNRYVVFSENPVSVHIRKLKALKHDAILVLRPGTDKSRHRDWPEPLRINSTDSYAFCRDCGTALGYFLSCDLGEQEIRSGWRRLLGGNGNGKTSC